MHEKKLIIHYSRSAGIRSRFASVMGNPVVAHKNNHSHSPQRNEVIGTRRLRPICSGWAARCCAIVVGAITATDANCPLVWLSSRQVKRKKTNSPSLLMLSVFLHGENIATVARRDLKFTSPEFVNNYQTTNISNDMQQNDSICTLGLVQKQNFGFSITIQTDGTKNV